MMEFFSRLFDTTGFPPRWRCGIWSAELGWLHIVSDVAIFGAYFAISSVIFLFALRRKDLYFPKLFWLFGLFILSCGASHLVEATIFWQPWYRLSGAVKLVTAIASWATVIVLAISLPKISALPGLKATTSRLEREAAARAQTESLFRSALEACPSGVLIVDRSGRIRFANSLILEWFGYEPDELLNQSVELLVPPGMRPHHHQLRESYFQQPMARAMGEGRDLYGVTKQGSEFPVEIGLNPVATPEGVQVLVNVIDITRRKAMQAALVAKTQDMEQLMYVVSHDLRSPLVTIEGFTGMIGEHLEAHQEDRVADDLARVKRATRTMSGLIGDVLELSRINPQSMAFDEVNVRDVLDQAATSLDGARRQADAQFAIEGDLPTIRADRNKLLQAFMNLMGNALKYGCPRPGATVTVGWSAGRQEIAFFVRDEGPGVEPGQRERIFQMFQRNAQGNDGSGLGLAIVRKIMELHNGRAWVQSSAAGGAEFWIAFPAAAVVHARPQSTNLL